jgi:hypothetical protein
MHYDRAKAMFVVLLMLLCIAVYIATVVWSFFDAKARRKSGILIALLVAIPTFWPLVLFGWLIFRPGRVREPD